MIREISKQPSNGFAMVAVLILAHLLTVYWLIQAILHQSARNVVAASIVTALLALCWNGFKIVHPNEGKVLQLFGRYVGTIRKQGLGWVNPLFSGKRVSLRVRNFESTKLKVNDALGNPVEIAAVVVWKVVDTAEAVFEVDDYKDFVHIQSEAELRNMATGYPYDQHEEGEVALRSQKIVEGAVGMVEMAIQMLSERGVLELDEERRVAMVSNLLVVLCGDENAQPILNTGTLYQ